MNSRIEYDLQALNDSAPVSGPRRLPARYAVLGTVWSNTKRRFCPDDTIHQTDDLYDAQLVCDLEQHCSGLNGYDSAMIWDCFTGREIPCAPVASPSRSAA